MIFYLLLGAAILFLLIGICGVFLITFTPDYDATGLGMTISGIVFTILPLFGLSDIWQEYAEDVAVYCKQQPRIQVYEDRVRALTERLSAFNYPSKSDISLDHDSPWATMVESLTEAEQQLASAKDERAIAIRSLESWRRGPFSGISLLVSSECGE